MDGRALRAAALSGLDPQACQLAETSLEAFGLPWERLAHDARQCARIAADVTRESDVDEDDVLAAVAIGAFAQGVFATLAHIIERSRTCDEQS